MKPSTSLPDLAALKKSTDLVAVVQSRGVKLARQGGDFVGLCPFHGEKTPSFRVTPAKNLFHCFGCGAAGSVIDFVMKKDGFTRQQAIDWLVKQSGGAIVRAASTSSGQADPVPSSPSLSEAERARLLQRVVSFYARTLSKDRAGLDYLKSRKLDDPTMLEVFQVGYCNGTLHEALPKSGEIIEGLKALGVLDKRGQEMLRGRVIVPIFDLQGSVCGIYGRNVQPCEAGERHRYLAGPRRGVFNAACAKTSQTLFIAESIFDAMALWAAGRETSPGQAGFRNVIALYGTEGFTADHEALLRDNGTTEIYLCLDNDESGKKATERLRRKLSGIVQRVHVIEWPTPIQGGTAEGVKDACDFFLSRSATDFESLLKKANPTSPLSPKATSDASKDAEEILMSPDGFTASYGPRRYELCAIEKPSAARLKATIKALAAPAHGSGSTDQGEISDRVACHVSRVAAGSARFHIDTVDFYLSRSRRGFIVEAARLFRETPEVVEMDLNRLIVQLESYVEKKTANLSPTRGIALASEGDRLEAVRLGRNPDLVAEILRDMEKLGAVGEGVNKWIGYLVMTSRKMDDPLALLILSGSGAGKSHLQDTILSLCPDEDLIKLTSLSDRALFYKGEDSLRHKVLAVEEEAGASGAHYAIRNLISSKKLVIETTIKNPLTGKMETQTNRVNGPTAVFQTTTNPEADAETRSRFILTSVDESAEQTRAILLAQRNAHTLEGMRRRHRRGAILARHHAFQRMLKPLAVLNPFEPLLSYGDDRLLDRRDNPKYLSFILAVTFLHQMQRAVKKDAETGDDYIESTLEDVAIANELAAVLLGLSLDDLSSPARRLLGQIGQWVREQAVGLKTPAGKIRFNRRELRESFKWTEARLRVHLGELVRMEYVLPVGGGMGRAFEYQLACDPDQIEEGKLFVPGLKSVEQLQKEAASTGSHLRQGYGGQAGQANLAGLLPHLVGEKRGVVATSPGRTGEVLKGRFPSENGNGNGNLVASGGGHIPVLGEKGACVCVETGGGR